MTTESQPITSGSSTAPAIFLWIVVICGLLYRVYETLTKVPALFGA
jgi:hypothetical protein